MIQIIEEDLVDWEPLVMRFHAQEKLPRAEAERLAKFVRDWFDQSIEANSAIWSSAKEWNARVTAGNVVEATCDLIPAEAVKWLAAEMERAFPTICEIRLGHSLVGPSDPLGFDWLLIDAGRVNADGQVLEVPAFTISFSPVTIAQFQEFMRATDYTPVADSKEYEGYLVEFVQGTMGSSPKIPMIGVTYDDACAYGAWANCQLPSEGQLALFFRVSVRKRKKFEWAYPCWSSTSAGNDHFVAGDGPYVPACLNDPQEEHRLVLHRHNHGWPDPACFRVLKSPN